MTPGNNAVMRFLSRFLFTPAYRIIGPILGMICYPFFRLSGVRFLNVLSSRIGHLCIEPDCFVKEGMLSLRPAYRGIILAPGGNVANRHMLEYWRKYFVVVDSDVLCALLRPFLFSRVANYDVSKYCFGMGVQAGFVEIQKRYIGQQPLLSLTESDRERGRRWLKEKGIPPDAWFACVHCREEGYVDGEGQTYRNSDISSYIPAMEAITRGGGWVIRMGHSSGKPLPPMGGVIDYAHLDDKSDWRDIFLCAACRFFVGSSSGLCTVAHVFGVPVVLTNAAPMSMAVGYRPDDLCIPKLAWSRSERRFLGFCEVFGSDVGNFRFDSLFSGANVEAVDNTPEDIRQVVLEMMESVDGGAAYTDTDEILQKRYKSLLRPVHYSYGTFSRIGRDFLRKYGFLLGPVDEAQGIGTHP